MNCALTGPALTITAAALMLATSAAAYEKFPLSEHGDWIVQAEVWEDGSMSCAAQTYSAEGTFDITMTDQSAVMIHILFDNPRGTGQIIPVDLVIAGVKRWQMDGLEFGQSGASFEFASPVTALRFMLDMQQGAQVMVTRTNQETAYGIWSLHGSRDAIDGLLECYRRISGVAA